MAGRAPSVWVYCQSVGARGVTKVRRFVRLVGGVGVFAAVAASSSVSVVPAAAADNAQVAISMSVSKGTAAPGEDFVYFLSYSCESLAVACDEATVTDILPAEVSRATPDVIFGGNFADVDYTTATGAAVFTLFTPLPAGATAQISITTHFPVGTADGTVATNSASIDAANAALAQSNSVAVTAQVDDVTDPTATLTTPPEGAVYGLDEVVPADYSCQDEPGGSGIASCQGTVADGAPIDTMTIGQHEFTVVAADVAGHEQAVTHAYSVQGSRPDGWVRKGTHGRYVGDGIYNTTGTDQSRTGSARRGSSVKFFVVAQNDAAFPDRLWLSGRASTRRFSIRYSVGGTDVSEQIVAGTYRTPSLAPGDDVVVKVVVTVRRAAKLGSRLVAKMTLTPSIGGSPLDVVKVVATRS